MIHEIPGRPGILELEKLVETKILVFSWLKVLRQEASMRHSLSAQHNREMGQGKDQLRPG